MAVTMVRLLALLPGDAGTCRVIENGNGMGANGMDLENKRNINATFTAFMICTDI